MKAGENRHEVAKRLEVSVSCVVNWLLRYKATGNAKPGQVGGHRPRKIVGDHREWVLREIAAPALCYQFSLLGYLYCGNSPNLTFG